VKPLLIVNPQSGGGKTRRAWPELARVIEGKLGAYDTAFTERSGHGIELAREGARAGHPLVVAVGGDGTFSEIVSGVVESGKEVEVGLIAQGTGGDFRRTLGIEHRLDAYLDALTKDRKKKLDVGQVTYDDNGKQASRYFVNILSAGMGGLVDRYVATASRALGGSAAYFGASLKALMRAELGHVRCELERDGKKESHRIRTFMIAICNGQYFGSGMHVAPMADPCDGMFEIVSLGQTSKLSFAVNSSAIYKGKHLDQPGAVHLRADRVTLTLDNERSAKDVFLLDLDGEPLGGLPITVEMKKGAVTLRA
jgi:YegS/Rv2252/BmrU family lipid kinase